MNVLIQSSTGLTYRWFSLGSNVGDIPHNNKIRKDYYTVVVATVED